jgi:hypothetical protein
MRASDADRDQVLATLSEAFQAGRLTTEELEERTGQALTSRTLDDLEDLTADLPAADPPWPVPVSTGPRTGRLPAAGAIAIVLIVAGVIVGSDGGSRDWRFLWVLILLPLIARRIMLVRARAAKRGSGFPS